MSKNAKSTSIRCWSWVRFCYWLFTWWYSPDHIRETPTGIDIYSHFTYISTSEFKECNFHFLVQLGLTDYSFFHQRTIYIKVSPAFGTRLLNASGKYGSGYAQTVGSIAVIYSLCEVLARYCRKADDAFNSVGAGIFTGAFYRCPYGLRASLIGAAVGFVGGVVAEYSRNEYERLDEIIAKFRYKL